MESGCLQHLRVCLEVIAQAGEDAVYRLVHAYSLEVIHRPGNGEEVEDEIEGEKRSHENKATPFKLLVTGKEVKHAHHDDDGEIAGIGYLQYLTDPRLRINLGEAKRRLKSEDGLIPRGNDMVLIGKKAIEVIGIAIPPSQQEHLHQHPQELRETTGNKPVDRPHAEGNEHDAHTSPDHGIGLLHLRRTEQHDEQREHCVDQHRPLQRTKTFAG